MDLNTVKRNVNSCIVELIRKFKQHPEIFLTEDDVRCYLYNLLQYYSTPELTANKRESERHNLDNGVIEKNTYSIPIHCEVRWYGSSGNLRYRSDIVLVQVNNLITNEGEFKLPSKGYGFNKFYALIELKLRRITKERDEDFQNRIDSDREKIREIRSEMNELEGDLKFDFLSYLLVFDKKRLNFVNKSNTYHREHYTSSKNH